MSFFKTGKYKMGGGSSKSNSSHQAPAAKEHFQVLSSSTASNTKPSKSKAPPKPGGEQASIRFSNKTKFDWKLHNKGTKTVFPDQVSAGENKQLKLNNDQSPAQATYVINVTNDVGEIESFEFDVTLAKNDGTFELIVDWKLLNEVKGIRLKPDLSNSNQPMKLGTVETIVGIEIK